MNELSYLFIFIFFGLGILFGTLLFKYRNKEDLSSNQEYQPKGIDVEKILEAFSSNIQSINRDFSSKTKEIEESASAKLKENINQLEERLDRKINAKLVDNNKLTEKDEFSIKEKDNSSKDDIVFTEEDALLLIDSMVGMKRLKEEVHLLVDVLHVNSIRESLGKKPLKQSLHSVFFGSPGTGKTSVARLLGQIYKASGILSKGHVVEVSRSDLVSQYIGHTALLTNKKINEALGGILFIDEAYSLYSESGSDYGSEVINTLIKRMEDDRGDFIVIMAGYQKEMHSFLNSNTGLKSRFTHVFHFETYTPEELITIFSSYFNNQGFRLSPEAHAKLIDIFQEELKDKDPSFGNGRFARNLFERALRLQSRRLKIISLERKITIDDVEVITEEDIVYNKSFDTIL